jgi:hypothetical protein
MVGVRVNGGLVHRVDRGRRGRAASGLDVGRHFIQRRQGAADTDSHLADSERLHTAKGR